MKNEVSLCMIVKNEEKYLQKCLDSVKDIVDEMIIVDTGSTDNTVEIAKAFGAKVHYFQWTNNFSEARNESLKYATKDWILILDGDDELFPEDRENLKELLNKKLDEETIYFFETISYYGNVIDDNSITTNLNPRLFKNHEGTHYEGEIHNQLIYSKTKQNVICSSIKVHHYGYLASTIDVKSKRERNIKILEEQIKRDEKSYFAYFNLGTEYAAMEDRERALSYFYKAYEGFDPEKGYGNLLIFRIAILNYNLKNYAEASNFINIGLEHYPQFTDLYFLRALVLKDIGIPTLQIKALEKCIQLGEAPSKLKCFYGVGSFKAYYELGNVYLKLKDYDAAYDYYIKAMKINPEFTNPIYFIAHILKYKNTPIEEIKSIIEELLMGTSKENAICADVFYVERYYKAALEYVKKCEELGAVTKEIINLKAKCLVMNGDFRECADMKVDENNLFNLSTIMYKVIGCVLTNNYEEGLAVIKKINTEELSPYDKKLLKVYTAFVSLLRGEPTSIISEEEDEKDYIEVILDILEILLANDKIDEFEIAVNLLNLINNKNVLLALGKLYYRYGYIDIAKKEVIRSIKEFEIYDIEGLDILKS